MQLLRDCGVTRSVPAVSCLELETVLESKVPARHCVSCALESMHRLRQFAFRQRGLLHHFFTKLRSCLLALLDQTSRQCEELLHLRHLEFAGLW